MPAETNYTLEVYGRLWSGAPSVYSYTLTPTAADELMTLGNASQYADDFASVFDWRLVRGTHDFSRNGAL